ncbi:NarK family nitrate/nitrite MFS transporter [Magnetospirillum sp. 15-1]|uniref:NarK family nitrate/nitrite MFS transporter n=1 Tax=Magnetospirillum sp. 15-1 TaxID=1979370 RepID=UPI000BBBE9BB|nr:NarK family nitrate/nitrite MFS transporter [Magnetospirillum sp. 15-1]
MHVDDSGKLHPRHVLTNWTPEDPDYWESQGRKVAMRNLWISMPALLLAFAVWMVWSVVVVNLPNVGFKFDTDQLFWLASMPGLAGATLRIFYSFMVPIFGGRAWTALSTASLLFPAAGIGFAVQDPTTPYAVFLGLALLCGFGGGNFASSMANISFFFPKHKKGMALGLNAGIGNLGVSVVQFVVPIVIASAVFSTLGGEPQTWVKGAETKRMWLQNAGFIWIPFILACSVSAWFGMNDIASAKASFREQAVIFKRKHNWIMCWLYLGTFGSFIGYSAGFALLTKTQFPNVNPLAYAFLGPLVGSVARVIGGFLSDRFGGGRVTFWTFLVMMLAVCGVLYFLGHKGDAMGFNGFLAMFLLLFAGTGVGNASTFQMIPVIFATLKRREGETRHIPEVEAGKEAAKEAAAVLGFSSALAAYGAFFIPRSFGTSISMTGGAQGALYMFLAFYVTCVAATWWWYTRKNAEIKC